MGRKHHNHEAGYVAERTNPYAPRTKVVIYVAAKQGLDVDGKYAVVCDAHGTITGATSVPKAREMMKAVDFCEACMDLAGRDPVAEAIHA